MQGKAVRGFTLVELMMVVTILGILIALALPGLAAYRTKAANTAALSDVKNLTLHELTWYDTYQQYIPFTLADINANRLVQKTFTQGNKSYTVTVALSANVDAIAKTGNNNGTAIVAARCITGDRLVAMEVERDNTVRYVISTVTPMDTTLVPASTTAVDLASWKAW